MAKPELGGKRQCQSCGTKFFDLNKDPIVCPNCGTVFQLAASARAAARAVAADEDDEIEVDPAAAELVPLEEADVEADPTVVLPDDDIELDDEPADDTFLEEEEEDGDDVSGLIDGDIESDEES
ncbi:MAG: TIGR02300 family protein [Hyphomicrobiales bacterium]|nr:TIGR02300 family protein [Hyphomicrobiales bacterium]MDE2115727.1 TIGR02300 family protein [Hyphomicrobiales bacterium]